VLGLVVAEALYRRSPEAGPGELTRGRAARVSEAALAEAAVALGLPACLRLGRGEEGTGGRARPSVLASALEAVIGAVYLDGGLAAARRAGERLPGP
jgi:ribonuclease-3